MQGVVSIEITEIIWICNVMGFFFKLMMDTHRCIAIGKNCLPFRITRVHFRLFGSLCCSCAFAIFLCYIGWLSPHLWSCKVLQPLSVHPSTGTRITISHKYALSGNLIFSTRLPLPERGYKKNNSRGQNINQGITETNQQQPTDITQKNRNIFVRNSYPSSCGWMHR
jgi:hypothetical protein